MIISVGGAPRVGKSILCQHSAAKFAIEVDLDRPTQGPPPRTNCQSDQCAVERACDDRGDCRMVLPLSGTLRLGRHLAG